MGSYVDHTAVHVTDLDKHVEFFLDVFGITVVREKNEDYVERQVWLSAGIELIESAEEAEAGGANWHIGIMVDDYDDVLKRAYAAGCIRFGQGENWFRYRDGPLLEVLRS